MRLFVNLSESTEGRFVTWQEATMPKAKKPKEKPGEQFKRFVETAHKLEVDQETSDRSFKRLAGQAKSDPTARIKSETSKK